MLRDYQQRSIDELYAWMEANTGHPCLVLPTGAGKSHVIAALCKDALQNWPETRILMLTHVKELIEQNAEKMRQHWPNAPMGIYSASLRKKELGEPITFAGIQSIINKIDDIGHTDLIIIDECHLVSHKNEGSYRILINHLTKINPALRVIGLSATPYRLGHGLITDGEAIFDDLIKPITIDELIFGKYLAPLRSKITNKQLSTEGVHKRGGEYIESELQEALDTDDNNYPVVDEVIALAEDRKAWLFFCTGIEHAEHVKEALINRGISAECVTGKTTKADRERILKEFKAGNIKALTNCNVLTTGFDYPDIDLIAMLRPTMSASLYVQMAGRGLRPKSHTDHCLVLDFAGVVQEHGPIVNVNIERKISNREGTGEAPFKTCDNCHEIVHLSAKICPACGTPFVIDEAPKQELRLRQDDIMGIGGSEMNVTGWNWVKHISKTSGIEMIKVTYYGALSDKPVSEYLCVNHDGYAGKKAIETMSILARQSGAYKGVLETSSIDDFCSYMNENSRCPEIIEYKMDGKYARVIDRRF